MSEKIALVTGATSGIGKETARVLARLNYHVVIGARSEDKAKRVVDELMRDTGNKNIEYIIADLSLMREVRKMAEEFKKRHDKLHLLINNAGAYFAKRKVTDEGNELTLALNHLAPFLLTNLLLDLLKKSAPARVVTVSSAAHDMVKDLDLDDIQSEKKYRGFQVYGKTKLMNILFTKELAKRLKGTGVTANCLHPGFVRTGFGKNNSILHKIGMWLLSPFAISPKKSAEGVVYVATSPEIENISGEYFHNKKIKRPSRLALREDLAKRLWEISEKLVGLEAIRNQ